MKKKAQVIMLPTDKASDILINTYINETHSTSKFVMGMTKEALDETSVKAVEDRGYKYQHLYITTDDKIKDGDWYIIQGASPEGVYNTLPNGGVKKEFAKKIIATTDTQLLVQGFTSKKSKEWKSIFELPQPSQSFIESYCKNPVDKVMVEYESINLTGDFTPNKILPSGSWVFRPKLTSNNELIISMVGLTAEDIIEQMGWNYENTESSARRVAEFCAKNMNWIKENL
jgi:hypothetical protein